MMKNGAAIIGILLLISGLSWGQSAKTAGQLDSRPIVLGMTEEIHSLQLSETRVLNIYLPEGYGSSDTIKYPVIYLLDGGMDEDFIHIVGLVQFSTFPWVNRLPPSIVVGIANTDRKRDMTFPTTVAADKEKYPTTGGSSKFIAFLEKELQPYIRKKYKTDGSAMIIGESLGGLLATEILLQKPYLFDRYIIVSPSLWWDNGAMLKKQMAISASQPSRKTDVYIGVGKEGLAPSVEPHVMEVDANVLVEKIKAAGNKNINLQFDYMPEENHATIMHQAVLNAFKKLFPDAGVK